MVDIPAINAVIIADWIILLNSIMNNPGLLYRVNISIEGENSKIKMAHE